MLSNPKEEEKLDPRVKRTRQLILRAFEDLLAVKNFESISVQDVTEKAEINRATFYAHFPDKYALLDHSISQMFKHEIEKRTLNACHYTPENLRNLILAVCEFLTRVHSECAQPHQQFKSPDVQSVNLESNGLRGPGRPARLAAAPRVGNGSIAAKRCPAVRIAGRRQYQENTLRAVVILVETDK